MDTIIFSMAICLDAVIMATMGKLAVEVSASSFEATKDVKASRWFCNKCEFSTQNKAVNLLFVFYILIALGILIGCIDVIADFGHTQ